MSTKTLETIYFGAWASGAYGDFEANKRAAKKMLVSSGGRCNFTKCRSVVRRDR